MKSALPLLALVLLAGCATPPAGTSTPSAPPAPAKKATVSGDPSGAMQNFMGDEIHCQIQSIDGDSVAGSTELSPGSHKVIVLLSSQGQEYVGVIQIGIPAARAYRLSARRRDDAVTVTLTEGKDKLVATSTASLSEHMKFYVFVNQK